MYFSNYSDVPGVLFERAAQERESEPSVGYREGREEEEVLRPGFAPSMSPALDALIAKFSVPVLTGAAAPRTGTDRDDEEPRIEMIDPERAESPEAYTRILAHELVHWTGRTRVSPRPIPSGLNWLFSPNTYPKEELVADTGAAILLARLGLDVDVDSHAAYLKNWLGNIPPDDRQDAAEWAKAEAVLAVDALLA